MIYIYDILLNFNSGIPFEFFEWSSEDKIMHMKKIPLYKVNRIILEDLFYGDIVVNTSFLEEIKNRAEVYQRGNIEKISYASIFTDGTLAIAIEFNTEGESICKSRLLLDEEEEVLEVSEELKEIPFSYYCKCKNVVSLSTRFENEMRDFLKQEIEKAAQEKDNSKIAYFYEECFEKKFSNQKIAIEQLLHSLEKIRPFHKKLYRLLKNSYQMGK